jgi:hypothetical protein
MGHGSPDMIFNDYREIVTLEEAERYWQIFAAQPAQKVVPMPVQPISPCCGRGGKLRYKFNGMTLSRSPLRIGRVKSTLTSFQALSTESTTLWLSREEKPTCSRRRCVRFSVPLAWIYSS